MLCKGCRKNEQNNAREIAGHCVCDDCWNKFKQMEEIDMQMARDWLAKLGKKTCGEKARRRFGMRGG